MFVRKRKKIISLNMPVRKLVCDVSLDGNDLLCVY